MPAPATGPGLPTDATDRSPRDPPANRTEGGNRLTSQFRPHQSELAQRTSDGIEVTLVWVHDDGEDRVVVTVYDSRNGSFFEIPADGHLALDVYYHPFAYWYFGTVVDADSRLEEVVR